MAVGIEVLKEYQNLWGLCLLLDFILCKKLLRC